MVPDDAMVRVEAVCFAAQDPLVLARFWADTLRWEIDDRASDQAALVPTDGTGFGLAFRAELGEKAGLDRAHLDLATTSPSDHQELVNRVLELGGRHLDIGQGPDARHAVMADPEGNEFCVVEPENTFLAGCPRVGAISCDGSHATGSFWSAALGWPLVWDQDEETAIRAPDLSGPLVTWGGPPVAPKHGPNRLRLEVAPVTAGPADAAVERLLALGARRRSAGPDTSDRIELVDPDDNEFCVVSPRSR